MISCLNDYVEPSLSFGEHLLHFLSCMEIELAIECTSELTKKATMLRVVIKGFNCMKRKTHTS